MSRFQSLDAFWDRSETVATYCVLSLLATGQLAGLASKQVESFMNARGSILLLAVALLLVFRRINRQLERTATPLTKIPFADAVHAVCSGSRRTSEFYLFANDGTKYYHFIADQDFAARKLRVLLCDVSQASKWRRLVERRLIEEVEVRHASAKPILHIFGAEGGSVMTGPFIFRDHGKPPPGETFLISPTSVDGRRYGAALAQVFESAWATATPLYTEVEIPQPPVARGSHDSDTPARGPAQLQDDAHD